MMIPFDLIASCLYAHNIKIKGILHVGAHECEELDEYINYGLTQNDIIWIDALQEKVDSMNKLGIINIYCNTISNICETTKFNIANNYMSSSLHKFGTHSTYYPEIIYTEERIVHTITLEKFFETNNLNPKKYNFWNLDIQGGELNALISGAKCLDYVDAIYLEVSVEELYEKCATLNVIESFLNTYGFINVAMHITHEHWGEALFIKK